VQLVASVVDQLSIALAPPSIELGFADSDTVGAGVT
jgi:hypothetical protein